MPDPVDIEALTSDWRELAGEPFGSRSSPAGIHDGVLTVVVDDGAVASLLRYRLSELLELLGERLGAGVVSEIKIRVDSRKKGL